MSRTSAVTLSIDDLPRLSDQDHVELIEQGHDQYVVLPAYLPPEGVPRPPAKTLAQHLPPRKLRRIGLLTLLAVVAITLAALGVAVGLGKALSFTAPVCMAVAGESASVVQTRCGAPEAIERFTGATGQVSEEWAYHGRVVFIHDGHVLSAEAPNTEELTESRLK